MKRTILFIALFFAVTSVWSQKSKSPVATASSLEDRKFRIPLIGEKAPSFAAVSTNGQINFPEDYGRKWKVLLSHPQDFTPVCSSEILELAHLQSEFDKLGVKLVVVSTDPIDTHVQWKKALEDIEYKSRDRVKIKFPLVDDKNLSVSKLYGMIHESTNSTRNVRGVFIVDPENTIRAIYFYPMEIGRSTDELVRTITALHTADRNSVFTPADWRPGNDVLVPYLQNTALTEDTNIPEGYFKIAWFMWYKKGVN